MSRLFSRQPQQGLGFADTLVGLGILSLVTVGAMRVVITTQKTANTPLAENQIQSRVDRSLEQLVYALNNAVDIKSSYGTLLQNLQPSACGSEGFSSGIIPLPGYLRVEVDSYDPEQAIDPSDPSLVTGSSNDSDAMTVVAYAQDGISYPLAFDPNTNLPYPTNGTNSVVLDTSQSNFKVGDFAYIVDDVAGDIFRITGISQNQNGDVVLQRSNTISIWNLTWSGNFGIQNGLAMVGGARIHKVDILTFALDPSSQALYVDNHSRDDGFNPATLSFEGSPGLTRQWSLLQSGVTQMQIHYVVTNDPDPTETSQTRTPRAASYGASNQLVNVSTYCGNQIGAPYLRHVEISLSFESRNYSLIGGASLSGEGGGEGLASGLQDQLPVIIEATQAGAPNGTSNCLAPCWFGGGA